MTNYKIKRREEAVIAAKKARGKFSHLEADDLVESARHYVSAGKLRKAVKYYEKAAGQYEFYTHYGELYVGRFGGGIGTRPLGAGPKEVLYEKALEAHRNAERLRRILRGKFKPMSKLEKAAATAAIIGLGGSIFFLSFNITGNVIGNLNQTSSNWIGGVLFIIGLASAFLYFRR